MGRSWRRIPRLRTLVALVVLAFLILVAARLASAPYDSVWLGQLASAQLSERSRGAPVFVEAVRIDLSGTAAAPLTLLDMTVRSQDGAISAEVPEVRVDRSLSGLFLGDFSIGKIKLVRPTVEIDRGERASSAFPSAAELAGDVDAMLGAAVADFATFGIESIEVDDAEVDLTGALDRRFQTIDMRIAPDETGRLMQIDASVAGRAGRWNVRFRNGQEEKGGGRWFSVAASDVTIADLLPADYPVRAGRGLGLPLFPQAMFHLDADGKLKRGEMRLGVGAGYISLHNDDAILIDEMLLGLSWTPDRPNIVLEPSFAAFGDTRIVFHGEIRPPDATRDKWQFALETPQARLKPRDVPGRALVLDRGLAFGSFDPARMLLDIDTFNLRAGPISVTAAGSVEFGPDGPLAAVAVSSPELTVASLKRLWPAMMVPEARDWFVRHAVSGKFRDVRFIVALDPLGFDGDPDTIGWTDEGLRLDFSLEGGALRTIGDLPDLTDIKGTGTIRNGGFSLNVESAKTVAPGGGPVDIAGGVFSIPDLRPDEKLGKLDLTLKGEAGDIARIAAQDPVNGRSRLDISPDSLTGKATVTVSTSFPLRREDEPVAASEVAWKVAADLKDFSSSEPIGGQTVRNADLQVKANPAAAEVHGRGVLNGLPVEINLDQPLEGGSRDRNQDVVLDFDAGDLRERGIDLGGIIDGKLRLTMQTSEDGERNVVADLTQSELRLPEIGWTKGAGVPAKARFTVHESKGVQIVDDFRLTSDGVDVEGSLRLDKDGELLDASFSKFALRTTDNGSLSITRTKSGYAVELDAKSFDGRGLISKMRRTSGDEDAFGAEGRTLTVKMRADRLLGFHDTAITNFSLDLNSADGTIVDMAASGLVNGRSDVTAALTGAGAQRQLRVDTDDAGGLFRFVDFYERLLGGDATITVALPANGRALGRLVVSDLAITDDPALKKIVSADPALLGADSRPISRRRVLNNGEMSFQKLDVRFHKVGPVLTIDSGALRGSVLGGAMEGTINLSTQQVNMKGTLVPAYAVNNLFGQIPVLGQLVGGRNGGLLGVNFRVTGPLDTPVVSVNPMSAIAPGIFRKIFE